jgi:hypothetical protein
MREELPAARLRLGQVLMIAGLAGLAPACGDGPICASDISVFITNPDNGEALVGEDGFGVQTDVIVRTNLRATELIELRVRDEFGSEYYFTTAFVDETGTARVPFVFLPPGRATLEARGITEQCGTGEDFIEVQVGNASTSCVLVAAQFPEYNPEFALPLYNRWHDWNAGVEGLQADFDVYAPSEFVVELVVTDLDTGDETPAGTRFTDFTGLASYSMTVPEGRQSLAARCTSLDGLQSFTSPAFQVHVDSQPPFCALIAPAYGEELTPAMDLDGDPSNGTQIELVAVVVEDGVETLDLPAPRFIVEDVRFEGSAFDENAESSVVVTLGELSSYYLGIEAQDLAGNACIEVLDFAFASGERLRVEAVNRYSMELAWVAPGPDVFGGLATGYELRIAEEPIDEINFNFTGDPHDIPGPATPGTAERALIEAVVPGRTYYAALVAYGDSSYQFLGAVGPMTVGFDATPAIVPVAPDDGENGLGYQIAAGDFNGDGFSDVAVAAPFKSASGQGGAGAVYVYFGGAGGVSTTPGVTIEGDIASGQLGSGLTAIRWNDDAIDDLAVGAPFADAGQGGVLVFLGGDGFASNSLPTDANVEIRGSAAAGNWFAASGLGFALTRARFDDDARDDLIITAPGGGGGNGGVVVLYGGATATTVLLDSQSAAGSGDAAAVVLQDPDPGSIFGSDPGPFFGHYVFPLGRTQGAADVDDDIGVAYTEKNAAVVFRGRARPGSPGVALATFDPARDLEIQRTSSDDRSSRFGTSMGTIGDINNDGVREIVVGIWRDLANLGRIEIYRGNAVGVRNASTIRLRSITPSSELCSASGCGLGSAVVNNAAGLVDPDINGDGVEDLIVVGGMDTGGVRLLIWFGDNLPLTDFTSSTADYVVTAPAEFAAGARGDGDATPITALWAGDVNSDGLEDICWADWSAAGRDGAFQVLYDDGL